MSTKSRKAVPTTKRVRIRQVFHSTVDEEFEVPVDWDETVTEEMQAELDAGINGSLTLYDQDIKDV